MDRNFLNTVFISKNPRIFGFCLFTLSSVCQPAMGFFLNSSLKVPFQMQLATTHLLYQHCALKFACSLFVFWFTASYSYSGVLLLYNMDQQFFHPPITILLLSAPGPRGDDTGFGIYYHSITFLIIISCLNQLML